MQREEKTRRSDTKCREKTRSSDTDEVQREEKTRSSDTDEVQREEKTRSSDTKCSEKTSTCRTHRPVWRWRPTTTTTAIRRGGNWSREERGGKRKGNNITFCDASRSTAGLARNA